MGEKYICPHDAECERHHSQFVCIFCSQCKICKCSQVEPKSEENDTDTDIPEESSSENTDESSSE